MNERLGVIAFTCMLTACSGVQVVKDRAPSASCIFIADIAGDGKNKREMEADLKKHAKAKGGNIVVPNWDTQEIQLVHGRQHKLAGSYITVSAKAYSCK